MNIAEFNEQIKEDARQEAVITQRLKVAETMRDRFYREYVRVYDEELDALEQELASIQQTRAETAKSIYLEEAKRYLEENEEEFPPNKFKFLYGISLSKKPTEFKFPEDLNLVQAAKDNDCADLVRVKEDMDMTTFKKGLRSGLYAWAKAEPIEDVKVELRPLGDILIMMEEGEIT